MGTVKSITASEYSSLAEFRFQIRRFLRFSEQAARDAGIEPQQHQLLLALKAAGSAHSTIGGLLDRLQLRHHSVTGLVDRLENSGLVKRKRSDADHRSQIVRLTSAGERVLGRLSVEHREELRSTMPALIGSLAFILKGSKNGHKRPSRIAL